MNTNQLKDIAVSYALANGLLHGEIIEGKQYYTHMPISLFPFVVINFIILFINRFLKRRLLMEKN